ncbi:hypothetical protein [Sphingomonas sp. IW22]|uniref:hypothetical protein n=1 Tax=Sphingomonas sp. IW22 TaxID=3242489 RepID=UPI00351FB1E6
MDGRKLKIFVEESDKKSDNKIRGYFGEMRQGGMPFDATASGKYAPLGVSELSATLYDLKFKKKTSPLIQLADLYLYPICKSAYDPNYRAFLALKDHKRTVDCKLPSEAIAKLGVKYSCFDWKNTKGEDFSSPSPASITETS